MATKILIIEDEKLLAEQWEKRLRHEGFDVEIKTDPSDVIKALDTLDCDIILLDIMMPTQKLGEIVEKPEELPPSIDTGIWLCEKIKEKYPNLPVIGITLRTGREDLARLRKARAVRILVKPASLDDIIRVINEVLK
jgi:CheY-like chemotaxis protein